MSASRFVVRSLCLLTTVLSMTHVQVQAQAPCQVAELLPGEATGMFGWSVAMTDDWVVIGAPGDSEVATSAGAVWVFRRVGDGWVEHAKLTGSQTGFYHYFGTSVALDGDVLVVGAPHLDPAGSDFGQAYVFRRDDSGTPADSSDDAWFEEQLLVSSESAIGDLFGRAVDVSGDRIVVGATVDFSSAPGSAFVFKFDGATWSEEASLDGNPGMIADRFGDSVAIDGTLLAVAAPLEDGVAEGTGAVYVYRFDGINWVEEPKLGSATPQQFDHFGADVAIDNNRLAIGAIGDDARIVNGGAVYMYVRNGAQWDFSETIAPAGLTVAEQFGQSIALHGAFLAVSGHFSQKGYFYTFEASAWRLLGAVPPPVSDTAVAGSFAALTNRIYQLASVAPCIPAVAGWGVLTMSLLLLVLGSIRILSAYAEGLIQSSRDSGSPMQHRMTSDGLGTVTKA